MSTSEGFRHPEFLIETEALERRLGSPELRILDCTTHLIPDPKVTYHVLPGRADFEKGHIPGAQFVDLQGDLSDKNHRFRFMLPSAIIFLQLLLNDGELLGERWINRPWNNVINWTIIVVLFALSLLLAAQVILPNLFQ